MLQVDVELSGFKDSTPFLHTKLVVANMGEAEDKAEKLAAAKKKVYTTMRSVLSA
jgi:hypothetical protein